MQKTWGYIYLFNILYSLPLHIYPGVELLGNIVILLFIFEETTIFSIVADQLKFSATVHKGSLFSTPSLAFIICRIYDDGHYDWLEVIPHYGFDLHFPNN